jgi:hypothetical protein
MKMPENLYGVANQIYGQVHNSGKKGLERKQILEKCEISISEFGSVMRYLKGETIFWDVYSKKYYTKSYFPIYD